MESVTHYISFYGGIHERLHRPAVIVGGISVLFALVLSLLLILQHLRSYTNPAEQKWIVGVLFMVPVYATDSVLSLWNPSLSVASEILRSCYEAFALYCFGRYLVACLGGEGRVLALLENETKKVLEESLLQGDECSNGEEQSKGKPFSSFFLKPFVLGKRLYTIIKFGIVQYMILKIFCALLQLILELVGVYGDGEFKWYYGYPYIAAVLNFSQMWALYCLVQFYSVTHHRLRPIRPLAKFISFKAIVFATWWQGVGIAILCSIGILPKEGKFQKGMQDFLICIEMAIAAIAHVYVFSAAPYRFLATSEHGKVSTEAAKSLLQVEGRTGREKATVEQTETHVETPRTSVTESVQDVLVGGGELVVKDVFLTISQAIEPVEKGVNKIQETFHQVTVGSDREEGTKIEVQEHVEEKITKGPPTL
ncbi:protein LAZ1 homolog 2 [Aristolochia californica]|uniref:protein LAZ1 homolog 2 n=1 Tax=Aristolochia californica TaxID=171875 RepID=UPI0035DE0567